MSLIEGSTQKGVKLKIKHLKLRSAKNRKSVTAKGAKQMGVKQGLGVTVIEVLVFVVTL
jgi:isoprenylcysteine carboxyl methyltransferase (ICMT) family protein YpbQ